MTASETKAVGLREMELDDAAVDQLNRVMSEPSTLKVIPRRILNVTDETKERPDEVKSYWAIYVLGSTTPNDPVALFEFADMAGEWGERNYKGNFRAARIEIATASQLADLQRQLEQTIKHAGMAVASLRLVVQRVRAELREAGRKAGIPDSELAWITCKSSGESPLSSWDESERAICEKIEAVAESTKAELVAKQADNERWSALLARQADELVKAKGENEQLKRAADAWNMLVTSLEALQGTPGSEGTRDECLNAYIEKWSGLKGENTKLKEQLKDVSMVADVGGMTIHAARKHITELKSRLAVVEGNRDQLAAYHTMVHKHEIFPNLPDCECPVCMVHRKMQAALQKALEVFKTCDEQRLQETDECRDEAEKWKSEGDMYGWNFHQGRSGGTIGASIIYERVRRMIREALATTTPGEG